jgi:PIN domain nuclease of toxin-antitoxin system
VHGGPYVLDASVVLAVMLAELTPEQAEEWLTKACISAVNFAEVIATLTDRGLPREMIAAKMARLNLDVKPFGQEQAALAGNLRIETRHLGLSLGDRACLALAAALNKPAATADRAWAQLDLGIKIELVR